MLLQSHEGFLRILPALPKNWPTGSIKGLKARGNIEVDITWENGNLISLGLKSQKNKTIKIKYKGIIKEIALKANQKVQLNSNLD
ncbi:glycoside hydrolase family 95-like protein [Aureibaculum sp. 2210JD6-5]|uniref:glycoside hydrolase family 95-like protein n=1 Tax=Aureibaculum sp. 2210JD6-5 TaxID=3103957 RepID=UPI0039F17F4B